MDFYTFWFENENIWFNCDKNDDEYLTTHYEHLIVEPDDNLYAGDPKELLIKILIYDQLVRHIYRSNKNKIIFYHKYSLNLSLYVLNNKLDVSYSDKERCFLLLPLRHTFDEKYLNMSLSKIKEYRLEKDSKYYIRFYKANILALSNIKKLDDSPPKGIYYEEYLDHRSIKTINPLKIQKSKIIDEFRNIMNSINYDKIVISLSGGIDSMISSLILKTILNCELIAIMINYNNRTTCDYEVEFVKRWCRYLGIKYYIHNITEINRNRSHDREIYENVTRNIRFDVYRRFNCPVILGHNKDDCLENIFNNLKKERSLNDLRGMSKIKEENGVLLIRPMLNISKEEIREFAKKYQVPFLPNSTPSWSERGKIRDILVPAINSFDDGIIKGLFSFVDSMNEIYVTYEKITNSFLDKINEFELTLSDEDNYGYIFWKNIIHKLSEKWNKQKPSNKSIKQLTQRLNKKQYGNIILGKNFGFLYKPYKLYLLFKK